MAINWKGIATFLGYSEDEVEKVKALKLKPLCASCVEASLEAGEWDYCTDCRDTKRELEL